MGRDEMMAILDETIEKHGGRLDRATALEAMERVAKGKPSKLPADASPIAVTFPIVGSESKVWHLREKLLGEMRQAFPGIDVLAEARRAKLWIESSPANRKTEGGMKKFLLTWLGRAVDRKPSPYGAGRPVAAQPYAPVQSTVDHDLMAEKRASMKSSQPTLGLGLAVLRKEER